MAGAWAEQLGLLKRGAKIPGKRQSAIGEMPGYQLDIGLNGGRRLVEERGLLDARRR